MEHAYRAPQLPLTDDQAKAEAERIITAFKTDPDPVPTSYRNRTPLPHIGDAPAVTQPGRPPMSQRAVDISTMMLAGGATSLAVGGSAALVLLALGQVDATSLAIVGGSAIGLALAVSALLRSASRAEDNSPAEHHHHYGGPVHQHHTTHTSKTSGLIARNNH